MRVIGAALIGASCACMGILKSMGMKRRHELINRLISALELLETEIRFNRTALSRALSGIERLIGVNGFFGETARDMERGEGLRAAWSGSAERNLGALTREDRDIVGLLSAKLGMTDADGQIKQIEYVKTLLEGQAAQAEKEYIRLGRLYRSGGLLLGAFVVLILI